LKARRSGLIAQLAGVDDLLSQLEGTAKASSSADADKGAMYDIVKSVARLFSKGGKVLRNFIVYTLIELTLYALCTCVAVLALR
jgi:hypothetical protein